MTVEKPENNRERADKILTDDFAMPEWFYSMDGLSVLQRENVREELLHIASGAKAKRDRLSVLFGDKKDKQEPGKDIYDSIGFDPDDGKF